MHSAMEGSLGSTQHDVKLQFKTKTEHLLDIPTPFDIVHWEPAIEVMFLYKGVGTNEFNVSCETDYDLCPRPPKKIEGEVERETLYLACESINTKQGN